MLEAGDADAAVASTQRVGETPAAASRLFPAFSAITVHYEQIHCLQGSDPFLPPPRAWVGGQDIGVLLGADVLAEDQAHVVLVVRGSDPFGTLAHSHLSVCQIFPPSWLLWFCSEFIFGAVAFVDIGVLCRKFFPVVGEARALTRNHTYTNVKCLTCEPAAHREVTCVLGQ